MGPEVDPFYKNSLNACNFIAIWAGQKIQMFPERPELF